MIEYIKRLRLCIKWFQELELDYAFEQENLKNALEMTERNCADMGRIDRTIAFLVANYFFSWCVCILMHLITEIILKNKEEELNMIIVELRRSFSSLQEKLGKEEQDKLVRTKKSYSAVNIFSQ